MKQEIKERIEQINNGIVPEGYKKVASGVIPRDWDYCSLGKYLIQYSETSTENNQYPVLTSSRKGIFFQSDYYNKEVASEDNKGYNIVPRGYFTYRHMSDDEIFHFNINNIADYGIVSTLYPVFTTTEQIDDYYLQTLLNYGRDFNRYALLQKQGGSRTYMYFNKLTRLKVGLPKLNEQKKIAEILSAQDKVIELKEKLIEQKRLEKGVITEQVLFTEDSTISECKIGEICDTFSGGTPSRKIPEYYNGDIPWIKSGELNCRIITSADESISMSGLNNSSAKMVKPGTLLIAMYGATAGAIAFSGIEAAINQAILAVIPIIDINSNYLYYALESKIEKLVIKFTQGGQPNLNAQIIKSFRIKLPSIDAQNRICDILQTKDKEIELLEQKIEQEKQKKKALMQLLLTGIVRVKNGNS